MRDSSKFFHRNKLTYDSLGFEAFIFSITRQKLNNLQRSSTNLVVALLPIKGTRFHIRLFITCGFYFVFHAIKQPWPDFQKSLAIHETSCLIKQGSLVSSQRFQAAESLDAKI